MLKKTHFLWILTLPILGGVYFFASKSSKDTSPIQLKAKDSAIVNLGGGIYAKHCASCHGVNLEGQPNWKARNSDGKLPAPPHDKTGHTWHHSDRVLFKLTKYGLAGFAGEDYQSNMPAYEGILSDEEIIAVLSYIKSRWPLGVQGKHDQINKRYNSQERN